MFPCILTILFFLHLSTSWLSLQEGASRQHHYLPLHSGAFPCAWIATQLLPACRWSSLTTCFQRHHQHRALCTPPAVIVGYGRVHGMDSPGGSTRRPVFPSYLFPSMTCILRLWKVSASNAPPRDHSCEQCVLRGKVSIPNSSLFDAPLRCALSAPGSYPRKIIRPSYSTFIHQSLKKVLTKLRQRHFPYETSF